MMVTPTCTGLEGVFIISTPEQRDRALYYQWLKHEFERHVPRQLFGVNFIESPVLPTRRLDMGITPDQSCLRYVPVRDCAKPVHTPPSRDNPHPNRAPTGKRKRQWR